MSDAGVDRWKNKDSVSPSPISPRTVERFAFVLISIQVIFVAWSTSTTWFKQDDFVQLFRASRLGGFPGNLFNVYIGHLTPGAFTFYAINHKLFGMEWTSIAVVVGTLQLFATFLTWRVIRSLFGVRPISLLLLVVYVSSVLVFTPAMWLSSLMMYLPLQVALPASVLLLQRYFRSPTKVNAVLPTIAVFISLLFFEKCLFITPFLICLVAATPLTERSATTVKKRLVESRIPLLILTTSTSIYGVFYLYLSRSSHDRPQLEMSRILDFTLDPIFKVFNPSMIGGPGIRREGVLGIAHIAAASNWFELIASNVFIFTLIAFSAIYVVRWARFWIILYGFALLNIILLVAAGRGWVIDNPRNMSEIVFPAVVLIGLALGAGVFEPDPVWKRTLPQFFKGKSLPAAIGALFALVVLTNATFHAREVRIGLSPAPAYVYTKNALSSSQEIRHPVTLIHQYVSGDLLNGVLGEGKFLNFTSTILKPSNGPWTFADAARDAYMVLEDGTVVPAGTSHETVPQYENGLCNIDLHDGVPKKLTLNGDPFPWTWYGSITAATRNDVQITVDWNADPTTFTIPNGVSNTLFYIPGGGNTMTVTAIGGDVCVTDLGFGNLVRDPFR